MDELVIKVEVFRGAIARLQLILNKVMVARTRSPLSRVRYAVEARELRPPPPPPGQCKSL